MVGFNEFLIKPVDIPVQTQGQVSTVPVQNSQSGDLTSDLRIDKRGNVIAFKGDWTYFDVSYISYVSNGIVKITQQDVFDSLQIGDKVKLLQTVDKYFYVIAKDSSTNQIKINGGTDYVYTNGTVNNISFSKVNNPNGFPDRFNFDPNPVFSGGSGVSATAETAYYKMFGNLVAPVYYITVTSSSKPTGFTLDIPFAQGASDIIQLGYGSINGVLSEWSLVTAATKITMLWTYAGTSGNVSVVPIYLYFQP